MVTNTNHRDYDPNIENQSTLQQIVPSSNRSGRHSDMLSPVPSQRRSRRRRHISSRRRIRRSIRLVLHPENQRNRGQNTIESSRSEEAAATTTGTNSDDDDYEKPTLIKIIKQLAFDYTILAVTAAFTGYLIHWMETSFERRVLAKNRMIRFEAFQDVITNYNYKLILNEFNSENDDTDTTTTSIINKEEVVVSFATNTAQYHALTWLVSHDPRHLSPWNTSFEDEIIDRYTLATLYYSISSSDLLPSPSFENYEKNYTVKRGKSNGGYDVTLDYRYYFINVTQTPNVYRDDDMDGNEDGIDIEFGENHHINSDRPWLSKYPVCYWQGIHCNYMDQVTRIQFEDLSVVGTVPTELGFLGHLEVLDFSFNLISGTIPTELGRDTSMKHLNFEGNLLSMTIPTELGQLRSLKTLRLGDNNLTGIVPTEFKQLLHLESLHFDNNHLSGYLNPIFCDAESGYATIDIIFSNLLEVFVGCNDDAQNVTCDCCKYCPPS